MEAKGWNTWATNRHHTPHHHHNVWIACRLAFSRSMVVFRSFFRRRCSSSHLMGFRSFQNRCFPCSMVLGAAAGFLLAATRLVLCGCVRLLLWRCRAPARPPSCDFPSGRFHVCSFSQMDSGPSPLASLPDTFEGYLLCSWLLRLLLITACHGAELRQQSGSEHKSASVAPSNNRFVASRADLQASASSCFQTYHTCRICFAE